MSRGKTALPVKHPTRLHPNPPNCLRHEREDDQRNNEAQELGKDGIKRQEASRNEARNSKSYPCWHRIAQEQSKGNRNSYAPKETDLNPFHRN